MGLSDWQNQARQARAGPPPLSLPPSIYLVLCLFLNPGQCLDIPDIGSDKVEPTAEPSSRETMVCVQNGWYSVCCAAVNSELDRWEWENFMLYLMFL